MAKEGDVGLVELQSEGMCLQASQDLLQDAVMLPISFSEDQKMSSMSLHWSNCGHGHGPAMMAYYNKTDTTANQIVMTWLAAWRSGCHDLMSAIG